jgi:hypothetical protein
MDEHVLASARALAGQTNSLTDAFFQQIHDTYRSTSTQLAQDVVKTISGISGMGNAEVPFWSTSKSHPYFFLQVGSNHYGNPYEEPFDLALRLLKSDLCSAVHVRAGGRYFDDHSAGHKVHYPHLRGAFENIGRFLAEMKATNIGNGKTLLDDTLVLIQSEFGRTWPSGGTCDHWPATAVCFAGGGIQPNRTVGGYDFSIGKTNGIGFMGSPIYLIGEDGAPMLRAPLSIDVVYTALKLMGITDVFLPGGPGYFESLVKA